MACGDAADDIGDPAATHAEGRREKVVDAESLQRIDYLSLYFLFGGSSHTVDYSTAVDFVKCLR